jgi:hypothetical protein
MIALTRKASALAAVLLALSITSIPSLPLAETTSVAVTSEEDAKLVAKLVRSTLLALHHANETGNFTVLHALGAPSFAQRNNPGSLYQSFELLRQAKIALDDVSILQPSFSTAPTVEANRYLKVIGTFATSPKHVGFELIYEVVDRVWKVVGLSVWVVK